MGPKLMQDQDPTMVRMCEGETLFLFLINLITLTHVKSIIFLSTIAYFCKNNSN